MKLRPYRGVMVSIFCIDALCLGAAIYRHGATTLGEITYGYDRTNKVIEKSGSWARLATAAPLAPGIYNDADQLVSRGSDAFTYGLDGGRAQHDAGPAAS